MTPTPSISPTPMALTFGDFAEDLPPSQEYLILGFSPSSVPLKQRWRNNGLSADFLADYLTSFLPADEDGATGLPARRDRAKSAVSYIANELLENAMKFNDYSSGQPVSIRLQLHPDTLVFLATNSIDPALVEKFQTFIQTLTTGDPGELLLQRLEQNALDDSSSGLGILTMMNDYLAKVGWKFTTLPTAPEVVLVSTMVRLVI